MFRHLRLIDRPFLIITAVLIVAGFFIFTSASLGLLTRDGARFSTVAVSQLVLGLGLGFLGLLIATRLNYRLLRVVAYWAYAVSLIITALTLIPGIGFSYNGASRWIHLGSFSFQPAELLKFAYVVALASWMSVIRPQLGTIRGLLPYATLTAPAAALLLAQPDTGTFLVLAAAGLAMILVGGVKWRYVLLVILLGVCAVGVLALTRVYVMDRITSFLDPSADPLGSGYQLQQGLIAIGSGGLFGRGFGQSIQKFSYLPEPTGDSIFAVYAEEFGFVGAAVLVSLFLALGIRGMRIASRAPDVFGALMVTGFVVLIVTQSLINIGSMLGLLPLTGVPLLFISHGGTALLFALIEIGIILAVSRSRGRAG